MDTLESINALTRQAYNLAAQKYHDLFHNEMNEKEYDRKRLDSFAAKFNKDFLICDAGCGPSGHIGRYLFDKGTKVVGVDISEKCVELARINNPEMKFECADICSMPFDENTFDGLLSYYSIINTPKIYVNRIFSEFRRVLKPDGFLLVAVKAGTTEGYVDDLTSSASMAWAPSGASPTRRGSGPPSCCASRARCARERAYATW